MEEGNWALDRWSDFKKFPARKFGGNVITGKGPDSVKSGFPIALSRAEKRRG